MSANKFGINVIGYISGNLGVGVTARNIVAALLERGVPVTTHDVDPGIGRGNFDNTFVEHNVQNIQELPYSVNLFVFDPFALAEFLAHDASLVLGDRLNVAFSMWELTVLPKVLQRALKLMDILIAESDSNRSAFDLNISGPLMITAEHPIYLPEGVRACRERFGLPQDSVLFLTSFEPHSDPRRKNPFAVVAAFDRSLANDPRAHLVIKLNNWNSSGKPHPVVRALLDRCGANPRIHLITETLTYPEVLSLYASSDVLVSLHRGEGLGLPLMEAMLLGKPVIATAWSGNMSFMTHVNSCLVRYKLIPVEGSIDVYSRKFLGNDAVWADPSIDDAAAWMKELVNDPDLRRTKGQLAAKDMEQYQQRAKRCEFLDEIQAVLDYGQVTSRRVALREREIERLRTDMAALKRRADKRPGFSNLRRALDRHVLWRFRAQDRRDFFS